MKRKIIAAASGLAVAAVALAVGAGSAEAAEAGRYIVGKGRY